MSEALQEFVVSRSERLRVDRAAGIIRGVKLLGLSSRNGRRYREHALREAIALYEGAKVNVNHPKGHPLAPRDYQDRLGEIRGVEFRAGHGLFGDLHFNPKHALSEQLTWDAQHAPQNVGLSHNVLARTVHDGDATVVEAITKVQSIDLVADPASTAGLFEHLGSQELRVESREPDKGDSPLALDSKLSTLDSLTLEQLELHRPDLVRQVRRGPESQLEELHNELEQYAAREAAAKRRERIVELLQEHDLPMPTGDAAGGSIVNPPFLQTLLGAGWSRSGPRWSARRAIGTRAAGGTIVGRGRAINWLRCSNPRRSGRGMGPSLRRRFVGGRGPMGGTPPSHRRWAWRRWLAKPRPSPGAQGRATQSHDFFQQVTTSDTQETDFMASTMRWRYGDTNPVMLPVDSATVIEIGDMVYLDTDDAKPASAVPDQGTENANQQLFHDAFAGVAMQASAAGDTDQIRVAATGVFEFDCLSTTLEVGDLMSADENAGGTALLNQTVAKVTNANAAIGRCAKRLNPAGTRVLVDVVSAVLRGGAQAVL